MAQARKSASDFARQVYQATLGVDQGDVSAGVKQAEAIARRFAGQAYDAVLGVDYASVRGDTAAAERIAQNFARQSYEAGLGVRGTTTVITELKAVDFAADRLDGRNIRMDIDSGGSGFSSLVRLNGGFRELAGSIKAMRILVGAGALAALPAALGVAIPTVAALAASVGGLAVALGQGLIGAIVPTTAALGALGGAFALVAAPVAMLLGNLKDYDTSLDSVASAQDTARAAAQTYADAQRRVGEAQRGVADATRSAGQAVKEAERAVADARREGTSAIRDAERNLAEARRSGAEDIKDAERALGQARLEAARSIADAERGLVSARQSAAQGVDEAEGELQDAREQLASATRSLTGAQQELNRALRDEPLNQREATLDLADARDRASDALRDYNKAVRENGRNSEEATDAKRELQRANLDLAQTELDVRDARRNGSDELQGARDAVRSAYDEQRSAAEGVRDAERGLAAARGEGAQEIADAQRTLAQAQRDASGTVADAQRDVAGARADAARQESGALRGVSEARSEAQRTLADAQRGVTEARREGAEAIADAQSQVADAQRAAAVAQKAAKDALRGVREETERLTPAQKALYDEYKRFQRLGNTAFRPAQNAAARLGIEVLRLAESYLPSLGRASEATVNALGRAFETFRSELNKPVEQAGITAFLRLIPRFTQEAATAAGRLALALFNVFTRSLKYALPFTRALGDMADQFLRFTRSAEGQNKIDRFFADSVDMGLRLLPIVRNLFGAFGNLIGALQRTGIVDQSVRGFGALAASFERSTRAGGGLDRFLRNAVQLMPFVGRATMDLVGAIGGIASSAIRAREQGSKLTTLQRVFQGISNAAKPLQRFVVTVFREMAPALAGLLPHLSRFFAAFGSGAAQTIATFVDTLTRAVRLFNRLPEGVKKAVGQFAALSLVLRGIGITALVAPMGRFASNMLIARGAAAKLGGKSALLGVVGGLARMGALLAGGIGLGLLVASLVRAYQKNEDFRKSVNRLGDKAREVFSGIQKQINTKVIPALSHLADKGANAIIDIFDLGGQKSKISRKGREATAQFGAGVRQQGRKLAGEGGPFFEIGFKGGRAIGAALNAWAKGGGGKSGRIGQIINSSSNPVNIGRQLGEGVKIGINKTNWRAVGKRIHEELGRAATNPAALRFIQRKLGDAWRWAVNHVNWKSIANLLVTLFFAPIAPYMSEKTKSHIIKPIREGIKVGNWGESGKNVAKAFVRGFASGGVTGGIIGVLQEAREGVKKWQGEDSPAKKQWPERGKNAGLGFVGGFDSALRTLNRTIDVGVREHRISPAAASRARSDARRATLPSSPGGKAITAAEMEAIMNRLPERMVRGIAAEVTKAITSGAYVGWQDGQMGGYFNHRNSMGADPR